MIFRANKINKSHKQSYLFFNSSTTEESTDGRKRKVREVSKTSMKIRARDSKLPWGKKK